MKPDQIAIFISGLALAIAIAGFVWSIWKEFIFVKPRVQVSFNIMQIFGGSHRVKEICVLSATNMGPGPITIYACVARFRDGMFKKASLAVINPIHGNPTLAPHTSQGPFSAGLPLKIDSGDLKAFYFPYDKDCFLKDPIIRLGVSDTYNRFHWCSKHDVVRARDRYWKDFLIDPH